MVVLILLYRVLIGCFVPTLFSGDMPAFSWLEPNYFDGENFAASDQHPDHDVSIGDQLIKDVYDAVRSSPLWEKTALIITYDEHGGFFDHVAPPEGVPSPDGINSTDDPFDFTRLGEYLLLFLLICCFLLYLLLTRTYESAFNLPQTHLLENFAIQFFMLCCLFVSLLQVCVCLPWWCPPG